MMGRPRLTNVWWRIGPAIIIDVSTKTHPRRSALIDAMYLGAIVGTGGRWIARQSAGHLVYASRHLIRNGVGTIENMHNVVMRSIGIDHRNRDGLDNRGLNLRSATQHQNGGNKVGQANSTSAFKGVSWKTSAGKWVAQIGVNYRRIYIGRYASEEAAARAYDAAAREHFGEFARLNFPGETP